MSRERRLLLTSLLVLAAALAGCRRGAAMVKTVATMKGYLGWQRVSTRISVDPAGKLTSLLSPEEQREAAEEEEGEDEDEVQLRRAQRMEEVYKKQFTPLGLENEQTCPALTPQERKVGTIYLLVHGVEGDGIEWWPVIPTLAQASAAALFMYRWIPQAERGSIVRGLVDGVNRISGCYPELRRLVIVAHSAGGVISSFAASRFQLAGRDSGQRLHILTVASPLAGVGYRKRGEDDDQTRLINDLGTTQVGYPAAAPGVQVLHFRTQYPADTVMQPNVFGHSPNRKGVGVLGAKEVDLPEHLGHVPALLHVAKELVAGRVLP